MSHGPEIMQRLRGRQQDPLSLRKRRRKRTLLATLVIGAFTFHLWNIRQTDFAGQHTYSSHVEKRKDNGLVRDVIHLSVVVFLTSGTSYTRPADWNNSNNKIECIGGGAAGGISVVVDPCAPLIDPGPGGGGGAYAATPNVTLAASTPYAIAAASGNTTWNSGAILANGASGMTAGSVAGSTGTTRFAGGHGGDRTTGGAGGAGGGGGGAGGFHAAGVNGGNGIGTNGGGGGRGDGTFGGVGGPGSSTSSSNNGSNGAQWTAVPGGSTAGSGGGGGASNGNGGSGGLYGGGGGGAGGGSSAGAGRQGIIFITYTPAVSAHGFNMAMLGM